MAQEIKPEELGLDFELKTPLPQPEVKPDDIEIVHTAGPEPEPPKPDGAPRRADRRIAQKHYESETAKRERDGAYRAAETYRQRLQQMEEANAQLRQLATAAVGANLDAEISKAEQEVTNALRGNAPEKVTELTGKLMELKAKKVQFQNGSTQYQVPPPTPAAQPTPAYTPYPETPDYAVQREQWRQQNAHWFAVAPDGQPLNEQTKRILQFETNLVRSGVVRGSSAYWRAIQGVMAPVRGTGTPTAVVGSSYSAAGNGTQKPAAGRKVVELSEEERRAAAHLGVSEKDYALEKYKLMLQNAGNE
jgi:hypothetical protein